MPGWAQYFATAIRAACALGGFQKKFQHIVVSKT